MKRRRRRRILSPRWGDNRHPTGEATGSGEMSMAKEEGLVVETAELLRETAYVSRQHQQDESRRTRMERNPLSGSSTNAPRKKQVQLAHDEERRPRVREVLWVQKHYSDA